MGCGMRLVWELIATWTGRDGGLVMDDNAAGCWMLDGCWIENASYCGWRRQPTKSRLAVETHDTDSGRLDMAGLTGALAAKLSGLPAEGACELACAVPRRFLRPLEPEAPALS